jgi:hypothetical protein
VRTARWKLNLNLLDDSEFYALDADLHEMTNLIGSDLHAATRSELVEMLVDWSRTTEDPLAPIVQRAAQRLGALARPERRLAATLGGLRLLGLLRVVLLQLEQFVVRQRGTTFEGAEVAALLTRYPVSADLVLKTVAAAGGDERQEAHAGSAGPRQRSNGPIPKGRATDLHPLATAGRGWT